MVDSSSLSSVEMVDLTQDTCILNKQQARRVNDKAQSGGLKGAQEMVKSAKNNMVKPSEDGEQERGLVISAAARKKILEMALGQSVSTFSDSHKTWQL